MPQRIREPADRESRRDRHSRDARGRRARHPHRRDLLAGRPLLIASRRRTRAIWSARAKRPSRRTWILPTSCASRAPRTSDAIHPGYGFLSENPEFAQACAAAGLIFVGPTPEIMRRLGNKVMARNLRWFRRACRSCRRLPPLPRDEAETLRRRAKSASPLMLKASWGGGGRGMRIVETEKDLPAKWWPRPGAER